MSDIVERLKGFAAKGAGVAVMIDAATEIEKLRAQVEAWRVLLDAAQSQLECSEYPSEVRLAEEIKLALTSTVSRDD